MTDKFNLAEKNEAWQKILIAFNSKNKRPRNVEQIKNKYDNMKSKARKIAASNKNYLRGIEGGPSQTLDLDPVIEAVLRIINSATVVGLEDPFDCVLDNDQIKVEENSSSADDIKELVYEENSSTYSLENINKHFNYNEQISSANEEQSLEVVDNGVQIQESREEAHKKRTGDWSTYAPKKLRTLMSQNPSEISENPTEEFYRKKMELIEEEIKKSKLEQSVITEKNLRDIEEHQKRMKLLDLEIKIKEQMLNNN
ncbi:hypothetical protein TcasGA2_TC032476 [Tribolium castaneum]|uniref:Regulatory protein zeste n=1 Tax=Tribolium castaneum TaxID=7070 RepID=A0A139WL40_TRICA|nr:hypothetical protein TcasGA2_TC032476 [Tribolium castaneum]